MTSFVDALYSRFADPKYSECNSCELFIIGSLSPGKSGKNLLFTHFLHFHTFPSTFTTRSLSSFSPILSLSLLFLPILLKLSLFRMHIHFFLLHIK